MKAKELFDTFSHIENIDGLKDAVRTDLVYFVEHQTEKPEDTSVLSCTKKVSKENGQDIWAFFCSIINFSVQVRKFMIPMLNGIAESIHNDFEGNFIAFVN